MLCPACAESLLPGKGLGTVRSYFIVAYYSCRKGIRFWVYIERLILDQDDKIFRSRTLPSRQSKVNCSSSSGKRKDMLIYDALNQTNHFRRQITKL